MLTVVQADEKPKPKSAKADKPKADKAEAAPSADDGEFWLVTILLGGG